MAVSLADFYFENGALVKFKGVRIEHIPVDHMRWMIREMGALLHEVSAPPAPAVADGRQKDSFGNDLIERELVSIVLRMTRHLPDDKPAAKKLHDGALDYLRRKNLLPSPLRAEETVVQSASPATGRGMTRQQVDLVVKLIDMKIRKYDAKDSSDGGLTELIIANETEAELRASAQEDEE